MSDTIYHAIQVAVLLGLVAVLASAFLDGWRSFRKANREGG